MNGNVTRARSSGWFHKVLYRMSLPQGCLQAIDSLLRGGHHVVDEARQLASRDRIDAKLHPRGVGEKLFIDHHLIEGEAERLDFRWRHPWRGHDRPAHLGCERC